MSRLTFVRGHCAKLVHFKLGQGLIESSVRIPQLRIDTQSSLRSWRGDVYPRGNLPKGSTEVRFQPPCDCLQSDEPL